MLLAADANARAISDEKGSGEGYLYRYRDLSAADRAEWVRQIIVDSKLYFSAPTMFNDPFDCQARFRVGDRQAFKARFRDQAKQLASESGLPRKQRRQMTKGGVNPRELLKGITADTQRGIESEVRVLSLSATHDNILMWSHYTNGHQGVCLQFRLEADRGFFAGAQEVKYSHELPVADLLGEPMERVDKLMLTKAEEWRYEREWRVIRTDGISNLSFPPELLTGVILGTRISDANKKTVSEWVAQRGSAIAIYQAVLRPREFGLEFQQIN